MADPNIPAGTQVADPYEQFTDEELATMVTPLAEEEMPTEVVPPPMQLDEREQRVLENKPDPYFGIRADKEAYESAKKKIRVQGTQDILNQESVYNTRRISSRTGREAQYDNPYIEEAVKLYDETFARVPGGTMVQQAGEQMLLEGIRTLHGLYDPEAAKQFDRFKVQQGPLAEAATDILTFVGGYAAATKALKAVGVGSTIARGVLGGAAAAGTVFDPEQADMSDLALMIPGLDKNETLQWLSSTERKKDSFWVAKAKTALTDALGGVAVEGAVVLAGRIVKILQLGKEAEQAQKAGDTAKAEQLREEAVAEADKVAEETGQTRFDQEKAEFDAPVSNKAEDILPKDSANYDTLRLIAKEIGILVDEGRHSGTDFKSIDGVVQVPLEGQIIDGTPAIKIFAHELAHSAMQKRVVSFDYKTPKSTLRQMVSNWDELVAAARRFAPAKYGSNKKITRHASNPNEVSVDAIASVMLGENDVSLIRPLLKALGMREDDFGLHLVPKAANKAIDAATEVAPATFNRTPLFQGLARQAAESRPQRLVDEAEAAANPGAAARQAEGDEVLDAVLTEVPTAPKTRAPQARMLSDDVLERMQEGIRNGDEEAQQAAVDAALNMNRVTNPEDVRAVIGETLRLMKEQDGYVKPTTTFDEISALADAIGEKPQSLTIKLAALSDNDDMAATFLATRRAFYGMAERARQLVVQMDEMSKVGGDIADLKKEFADTYSALYDTLPKMLAGQRNIATGLAGMRIDAAAAKNAKAFIEALTSSPTDMAFVKDTLRKMTPHEKLKAVTSIKDGVQNFIRALVQWRTGYGLLSGLGTSVTNLVGTGMWSMLVKPAMRAVGGNILELTRHIRGVDGQPASNSLDLWAGMFRYHAGLWDATKKAMWDRESVIDPGSETVEHAKDAFQNFVAKHLASGKGDAWDIMAAYTRPVAWTLDGASQLFPRFLVGQDEVFKRITYEARVYQKAVRFARDQKMSPEQTHAYIKDRIKNSYNEKGAATDAESLQYARESTHTQDIGETDGVAGKLSGGVAKLVAANPTMGFVLPFVRTPTNLLSEGVQMTPMLNLLSKRFRDNLKSPNPDIKAEAIGKLATSAALGGVMWWAVANGLITGAVPSDPELRRRFQESGRLPYAIRTSDGRWVQFNRMDPVALPLGILADVYDAHFHEADRIEGGYDWTNVAASTMLGITENLENKAYLQGITETMTLLGLGSQGFDEDRWTRAAGNFASTMLAPNFLGQLNPNPYLMETRELMDQTRQKLWITGLAEGLEPRRDSLGFPIQKTSAWILGAEAPNWAFPLKVSVPQSSPIYEALWQAESQLKPVPKKDQTTGVDFTKFRNDKGQTAYDRYQQLAKEVEIDGMTVMQTLEAMLPVWQEQYPDYASGRGKKMSGFTPLFRDDSEKEDSPLSKEIQAIIGDFRAVAKEQVLEEYPDLAEAIERSKEQGATAPERAQRRAIDNPLNQLRN